MNIVRWMTAVLFSSVCIYKYVIRGTGNIFYPSSLLAERGSYRSIMLLSLYILPPPPSSPRGWNKPRAADLAVRCDDSSRQAAATTLSKSLAGALASPPPKSLRQYIPFTIRKQCIMLYRLLNEFDFYYFYIFFAHRRQHD